MAIQFGTVLRNARLDVIETTIGTAPLLYIYDLTAGAPANCGAAITAGTLASMTLPSDWMAAASAGAKALSGTWTDGTADAAGTADFFRIYEWTGGTCFIQGTVGQGTGDLQLDNAVIAASQVITITTFTLTDGNA
jgi:hypothetical protein